MCIALFLEVTLFEDYVCGRFCGRLKLKVLRDVAPVIQKVDNAIHRIIHYPVDSAIGFPNNKMYLSTG